MQDAWIKIRDAVTLEQASSALRTALKMGGAVLIAKGDVSDYDWTQITGGAIALLGVAWSFAAHK